MTPAALTDLPLWPPTNLGSDPLVPLEPGELVRFDAPVTKVRLPTDATACAAITFQSVTTSAAAGVVAASMPASAQEITR